MADANTAGIQRAFSRPDLGRACIALVILGAVGALYWFTLPAIQSFLIPSAPGGENGPWVVRPILAFHFGAVAVMTATTMPLIIRPLKKVWAREDAALGTRYDPLHNDPVRRVFMILAGLLLIA